MIHDFEPGFLWIPIHAGDIGKEIEGIFAARETYLLSRHYGVEMPITEQTYKVLFENLEPILAVQNLLTRDQKPER